VISSCYLRFILNKHKITNTRHVTLYSQYVLQLLTPVLPSRFASCTNSPSNLALPHQTLTLVTRHIPTSLFIKNGVFWVVTPCGSCKNRRFGGTWRLATRRNNPEDTILHSHRRENLKSYISHRMLVIRGEINYQYFCIKRTRSYLIYTF
jgi:hypothetical protein